MSLGHRVQLALHMSLPECEHGESVLRCMTKHERLC